MYSCVLMDHAPKAKKPVATSPEILCPGVPRERRYEVEYPYWAATRVNPPFLTSPSKQRRYVLPQTRARSTSLLATKCQFVRSYREWRNRNLTGDLPKAHGVF